MRGVNTHLGYDTLQSATRLAVLGERLWVKVRRGVLEQPLRLDIRDCSDELRQVSEGPAVVAGWTYVGGGEDKLVVDDPFGRRVKSAGQMKPDHLERISIRMALLPQCDGDQGDLPGCL